MRGLLTSNWIKLNYFYTLNVFSYADFGFGNLGELFYSLFWVKKFNNWKTKTDKMLQNHEQ